MQRPRPPTPHPIPRPSAEPASHPSRHHYHYHWPGLCVASASQPPFLAGWPVHLFIASSAACLYSAS